MAHALKEQACLNQMYVHVSGRMYVGNAEHEPKILIEFRGQEKYEFFVREKGSG